MFNRMNLTLSARSLSNRLNLGTRSFALNANVKNGGRTLRIRHAHLDVLREAMAWHDEYPQMPVGPVIPSITGSFSRRPGGSGGQPRQPGRPAADVRVATRTRPADLVGVGVGVVGSCVEVGVLGRRSASASSAERSSLSGERSSLRGCAGRKSPVKPGLKRAARRAAASAAATTAIFTAAGPGK